MEEESLSQNFRFVPLQNLTMFPVYLVFPQLLFALLQCCHRKDLSLLISSQIWYWDKKIT